MFDRFRHRRALVSPVPLPEVDRTGKTCQRLGHVVKNPGTMFGWCPRCEHSIHGASGDVLYYGEFHRKVPSHDEEAEARTAEWAHDYVERCRSPLADRAALDRERRRMLGIIA